MVRHGEFDVTIIGGGPAGVCAALKLLETGYRVALVEQELFPRSQIGESLSPGIWNIFNYLKAGHLLQRPEYIQGLPASLIWESQSTQTITPQQRGPGIMVNRGILDKGLLDLAVGRGLHLFQPARYESCAKSDGNWQIEIMQNNCKQLLTGKFILDARGRTGASLQNKILIAPPTVSLWTDIDSGSLQAATMIEAVELGWLWGSPLSKRQFRVMAFVGKDELKNLRPNIVLTRLLSKSQLLNWAFPKIEAKNVRSCSVQSYCHTTPWKDNYICLGETAFTLDPLSSTGVEKAMRLSLQAVIAINTILKGGDKQMARAFYEDRLIESVTTHSAWTRDYYSKAWPGATHHFWRERSQFQPATQENRTQFVNTLQAKLLQPGLAIDGMPQKEINYDQFMNSHWHEKISISPRLVYNKAICVTDDRLEIKIAVNHPNLNREIAYIEQVEIKLLLGLVEGNGTLGDMIYNWSRITPIDTAMRIAVRLHSLGLLEFPIKSGQFFNKI